MSRALIIYAHPRHQSSRANRELLAAVSDMADVTVRDLYEEYPDFHIDVAAEQALLNAHELIIFMFPLYWYSAPALLKEWQDRVLNFALDDGLHHDDEVQNSIPLKGRTLWVVTTVGGSFASFSTDGGNRFTLEQYLLPYEQTARLCGMHWRQPFVVCQARRKPETVLQQQAQSFRSILTDTLQELSHA